MLNQAFTGFLDDPRRNQFDFHERKKTQGKKQTRDSSIGTRSPADGFSDEPTFDIGLPSIDTITSPGFAARIATAGV